MTEARDAVQAIGPALAFLLAGVPLAALMDRLGFFAAVADALQARYQTLPVVSLWMLAAVTTVVLNLDTTVVLLTPLYLRMARRANVDPLPLVLIPLLLAALASSALPVSNLTTLIASERLHQGVADTLSHLGLPTVTAVAVGWLSYRRLHPTVLRAAADVPTDRRALWTGSLLVLMLLVAFTVGPAVGVQPWMAAAAADVVLMVIVRSMPWRTLPVATAAAVAVVAALVALLAPGSLLHPFLRASDPLVLAGSTLAAAATANVINNIPATLMAVEGTSRASDGLWSWLLGVNIGAVLLPIGALANILWRRILASYGVHVSTRDHVRATWPIALPALVSAVLMHLALVSFR